MFRTGFSTLLRIPLHNLQSRTKRYCLRAQGEKGWFAVKKDAVLRQDLFGWFRKVE
ncbi:hypothetical protein HMPREF1989_01575 [Porphyromonas gingivalis F0566]|nr:hypothetical protein HMPREF1989_01575 [Porphyromonas gingivalis F0566]